MDKFYVKDSIENFGKYLGESQYFVQVQEFLKQDLSKLAAGKHVLVEDKCWANVMDNAKLQPLAGAKVEAHRQFIDIQLPLSEAEVIGMRKMSAADLALPFNEKDDYVLFEGESDPVEVKVGEFVILYAPLCGHAPNCTFGEPKDGGHRKIVIKVAVD